MGVKKLSRGRLFNVEKKGKDVVVDTGVGMEDAIVSATQHREGYKAVTDIVVDLGTSLGAIKSGGVTGKALCGVSGSHPIGDSQYVNICKVTDDVFGVVTSLEVVCLEKADASGYDDFDFLSSSLGTGIFGKVDATNYGVIEGANSQQLTNSLGVLGNQQYATFNDEGLKNQFIYLGLGDNISTAQSTQLSGACTITIPADFDVANMKDGATSIGLRRNNAVAGTIVHFSASSAQSYTAPGVDKRIGFGDVNTPEKMAIGVYRGVNASSHFSASVSGRVVTVTHAAVTINGNQSNPSMGEAPGFTSGITITDFSGSAPVQFNAGKFLLRFEGFMEPDDI